MNLGVIFGGFWWSAEKECLRGCEKHREESHVDACAQSTTGRSASKSTPRPERHTTKPNVILTLTD